MPKSTEEWIKDVESRTLFVAGFARSVTQDQLIDFFEKSFEGVCNMRMRRRDRDPNDDVSPVPIHHMILSPRRRFSSTFSQKLPRRSSVQSS